MLQLTDSARKHYLAEFSQHTDAVKTRHSVVFLTGLGVGGRRRPQIAPPRKSGTSESDCVLATIITYLAGVQQYFKMLAAQIDVWNLASSSRHRDVLFPGRTRRVKVPFAQHIRLQVWELCLRHFGNRCRRCLALAVCAALRLGFKVTYLFQEQRT